MDHFFGRLIAWAILVLCAGLGFPASALAQGTDCQAAADAAQSCNALRDEKVNAGWTNVTSCSVTGSPPNQHYKFEWSNAGWETPYVYEGSNFTCSGSPPANPCGSGQSFKMQYAGQVLSGMNKCKATPQPDGSSVQCGMSFTPISPPIKNDYGNWQTYGTYAESGNICGAAGDDGNSWKNADGSAPANPPPAGPDPAPTDNPPKLCGGVSCYDPKTGNYCAQGDSGMVCAPGPPPGQSGGSCASGGSATVCAGSPQAPKPPAATVPDPPTQTQGSDHYTAANPTTGQLQNITVGTYSTSGPGAVSSGATSSDTKPPAPASGSSSGGKDTTGASGGGDCNNPPSVSGSAALGMVATQAWQTRCAVDRGLNGTADAGDVTTPSGQSAWVDTPSSGDPIADNANKGIYDISGMGFSTACPLHDLAVPLWWSKEITVPFSKVCDLLGWLKAIVIGFAIYYAGKITVGGTG